MPVREGSWWPAWQVWLVKRSSGRTMLPPMGASLCGYPQLGNAPGIYVLQP